MQMTGLVEVFQELTRMQSTALRLLREYGAVEAGKAASREQRDARRARSRKRFAFWSGVAAELEKLAPESAVGRVAKRNSPDERRGHAIRTNPRDGRRNERAGG